MKRIDFENGSVTQNIFAAALPMLVAHPPIPNKVMNNLFLYLNRFLKVDFILKLR